MTHKLFKKENDIRQWLNEQCVDNYVLIENEKYGYLVNVNGHLKLRQRGLSSIKVKFGNVYGDVEIFLNQLTSLYGSPTKIFGDFDCSGNLLTSLEFCPIVSGNFNCQQNKINSLLGIQEKIKGYFYCNNNLLSTLQGGPSCVHGIYDCSQNPLISLEGRPNTVSEAFYIDSNLLDNIYLKDLPQHHEENASFLCRSQSLPEYFYNFSRIKDIKNFLKIKEEQVLLEKDIFCPPNARKTSKL